MYVGRNWVNFQIVVADESTRLFLNTQRHISNNNNFDFFFFNVSNKMRISQKCACTCIYDFPVTSIYVILQAAGLGYLIGGSIVVSDAAACKSASGKLNFWRHVINVQLPLTALSHTVLGVQLNSFSNRTTDDSFTSLPFYCNRMNFLYPLRGGWVGHRFDPDALD